MSSERTMADSGRQRIRMASSVTHFEAKALNNKGKHTDLANFHLHLSASSIFIFFLRKLNIIRIKKEANDFGATHDQHPEAEGISPSDFHQKVQQVWFLNIGRSFQGFNAIHADPKYGSTCTSDRERAPTMIENFIFSCIDFMSAINSDDSLSICFWQIQRGT